MDDRSTLGPAAEPAPAPAPAPQHSETRSSGPSVTDPTCSDGPTATPDHQPTVERAFTRAPERYQILGEFGRGGLGRVSRAHDRELGRDVAIKELLTHGHVKEVRFLREAMITARLEHPSIVPVHEAGRWPDGTPFYAMKLVAGRPLRDLIAERQTVEQRLGLLHHVIAVADAIAYAHGRSIIHRDLKPANVIVGDFGETIVIDWGLAKDLSATEDSDVGGGPFRAPHDSELTSAGAILGTPSYMAPEQERGERVDQRADVFALGAMLWELCSLSKLTPADARHRHRILRRAGIERDLAVILVKSLAPDPAHRYPDAAALAADLKAFKSGARISSRSYSPLGVLVHWARHHRTLTLSAATLLLLAAIGAIVYVRDIATERDRADTALTSAQVQARKATLANAALLLERDPTRAWSTLAPLDPSDPETALLRARVQAAGVADITIPFASEIARVVFTPSRSQLVVSTDERSLYAIDLSTGQLRRLQGQTTDPAMFTATDDDAYVVVDPARLSVARVSLSSGRLVRMNDLSEQPLALAVSERGLFMESAGGTLRELMQDGSATIIARGIGQFSLLGDRLLYCDAEHTLVVKEPGADRQLGPCVGAWSWAHTTRGFAVPTDESHISLWLDGGRAVIPIGAHHLRHFVMTDTGMLSVVDSEGRGAVLLPGSDELKVLHVGQPAFATAAFGSFAAWAFSDGSVKVIDTATQREWFFKAHDQSIRCIRVLPPGDRVVTCSSEEVRLWTLHRDAPIPVATLPGHPYNVVGNERGDLLFDSNAGKASVIARGAQSPTVLHSHSEAARSAIWCHGRACTGSWDGRVLCTSPDTGVTEEVARFGTATLGLATGGDRCFAAVSSGGLYDLSAPTAPLYRHDREPYRVSVSPDGTRIASTDWGGALKVWDVTQRRLLATLPHLHEGPAVDAAWFDGERLVTAGVDGNLHLLGQNFQVERSWHVAGPVKYVSAGRGSIEAVTADGIVWRFSLATGLAQTTALQTGVNAFAISRERRTMALGSINGEVFLIDPQLRVSARRPAYGEHAKISAATFEDETTLIVGLSNGRVMRLQIDQ